MWLIKRMLVWAVLGAMAPGVAVAQLPSPLNQVPIPLPTGAPPAPEQPKATPVDEKDIQVNQLGLFDVHFRDVALADAMRLLSRRAQRNVTVAESVAARVTADLYQVTFEEALDALLTPGGFAWFPRGKFIYVCKPEERDALLNAGRALETRVFELNFIPAAEVVPIVTKLLSTQGIITSTAALKVEGVAPKTEEFDRAMNEGLGGKSRAIADYVVVRDYPEILDEVVKVIAELDVRPRQVLVEAVILRARLTENNALGIDFNALGGVDFRVLGSTSTGGVNLVPGLVPPLEFDRGLGAVQTDFAAQVPPGGLSFGVITNNVATFIRALEETVDLTIVANPKVLTVHGQPGRVIVGRQDGYLTTTVTQTAAVQTVEFIESGTQILFRPFVGADGFVRMDIHPEDSDGGLTPDNLPFKTTTEVTANVVVKDGHTLVIGGLFRDVVTSRSSHLPYLGKIPLLGLLVSGKSDNAVREEVIVLITPHVIAGDEDSRISQWAKDEVERTRVLAHRGLMPWGRTRLAQAHYRWALEHYRAGHTRSALWDAELAVSLDPRLLEADRLREELSARETEEADASIIHKLVDELIAQELAGPDLTPAATEGHDDEASQ